MAEASTTPRVAFITGGSQGIGRAIAQLLHDRGWTVVSGDVAAPPDADAAPAKHVPLDVRDAAAARAAIEHVAIEHGRLDLLVNNAGVTNHFPLESLTPEAWAHVIDIDLNGVFNCLQAAGRVMLAGGGGSIVNITSIAGERGAPGRAPYSTAKAAVVGLTRAAAVEWAARGVRVNAVGPGYLDTGIFHEGVRTGKLDPDEVMRRIPADRLGDPADIAEAVAFLASDAAAYITGQVLYVDGGFLADYGVRARLSPPE